MSEGREVVVVHLDAEDFGPVDEIGTLRRVRRAATSVVSFTFAANWLRLGRRFALDPSLGLYEGEQYTSDGLFGIFTDIAPDRWGRTLLQRREAATARRERRRPRTLVDWDFLLGVSDELRMGALRLAEPSGGRFLSNDKATVPPTARLRQLQSYAQKAERGEQLTPREEDEEIALLVAPGSSLGGARPKANFRAADGTLWIAKFPSRNDSWDVGAWELVLNRMARQAGISVPETDLLELAEGHRTFTAQRFDRTPAGRRRLYASAMTLVGKSDNEPASYPEIAEAIALYGSGDREAIDQDLEQLFRRAVFNVFTAHRDDHLRNHGFLGTPRGWRLSPAFDLNPVPTKPEHTIALDEGDHTPDLDLVRRTAGYYRIKPPQAEAIIREVRDAVSPWRSVAAKVGIHRDETEMMAATAFAL
ncbi:MAG TPA: type II toxin-antitoxin system HipA family toxin [Candidatus Dormibacteraeota bacterium]